MKNQADPPVLFVDDTCVLCNGFVRYIFKIDKRQVIHFAALSAEQKKCGTLIFRADNKEYRQSEAIIRLFKKIGGKSLIIAYLIQIFPCPLRDFVYRKIAAGRYRFGRRSCRLPKRAETERVLRF